MDGHTDSVGVELLPNLWDEAHAASLTPEARLLYRSNLLGADKRITNFGGGNTSSKIVMADPLTGQDTPVLWVKGSGGDLGSMKLDGFATLYLDRLKTLQGLYRGPVHEDEMVALYAHCAFGLNGRAPSIDTPLHGLVDRACVDHMHPDAVIAIAASADSRALTREIYGDEIGWLGWVRPGFELGVRLQTFAAEHPNAKGVILEAHGLFTWGDSDREAYETTLDVINRATAWLAAKAPGARPFGAATASVLAAPERRRLAAALMPRLRGLVSAGGRKIGHFDDSAAVLDFVNSEALQPLAALGTSCPDHFLRTKIWPLVLAFDAASEDAAVLIERAGPAIEAYRARYAAYYERCKRPDSPAMRDANPVVYLIPGVGMITFAADKATARIAAEFYINAINVMREASRVSTYRGLPEQEAFDIEYWLLEEAKLKRLPPRKPLAGRIGIVTGGAGGIGGATARRLLGDGACVVICDIDRDALAEAETSLAGAFGADAVCAVWVDVTSEEAVADLYAETALAYGGVDICVSNAGLASASPIEDTSLELWRRNMDVLATGYFLVSREAVRLFKAQALGGSLVFIGSKNALAASPGASAYGAAKASELHLARLLAVECAPLGVRVNVVNPDAVLQGSRIWQGEWRNERAQQHKARPDELEAVYRDRSLLKLSVYPEDIAEAVAWFASDRSAKSTGNIINVDAGNAGAFTR
ncbi:MAG TPA: bifunctional rhamnulose-1-phosphate aldolase/short-chain dehydrogenase [Caulobacteraceae bacterium]|jgi:rhamnulose-1-phosphate aldolase/alcohol dehydrogenase|nr:bifunctional rhamnulose-1-phosphate aldolase/short-chain dehydrogenase [Caulobacteraceae bacterium]